MAARCPQCQSPMKAQAAAGPGHTLWVCPSCGSSTARQGSFSKRKPPSVLRDVTGLAIVIAASLIIGAILGLIAGAISGPLAACLAAAITIGSFWGFSYGMMIASPIVFAKDRILVAFSAALGAALGVGTALGWQGVLPSLFASGGGFFSNLMVGALGGVAMATWYIVVRVVERPFISVD